MAVTQQEESGRLHQDCTFWVLTTGKAAGGGGGRVFGSEQQVECEARDRA